MTGHCERCKGYTHDKQYCDTCQIAVDIANGKTCTGYGERVTIYSKGEFMGNIIATRATLYCHGKRKYAQYESAPWCIFTPERKRTKHMIQTDYKPWLVIVRGWDAPKPGDMFKPLPSQTAGVSLATSRYGCFDDGWTIEGDALIASIEPEKIIADYRHSVTVKQIEGKLVYNAAGYAQAA